MNARFHRLVPQLSALTFAALSACLLPAQAQNLADLYQAARSYDAG